MVALVHITTGMVVTVSDETAARLGPEWQPVKAAAKSSGKHRAGE